MKEMIDSYVNNILVYIYIFGKYSILKINCMVLNYDNIFKLCCFMLLKLLIKF